MGKEWMSMLHETSDPQNDSSLSAVSDVEAGIRDFVRNDVAYLRRPAPGLLPPEPQPQVQLEDTAEQTVNSVSTMIQRFAGTSLNEIENLLGELEALRDLLHNESQRVQREVAGYAQLSQTAMKSARLIADNVSQWKRAAENIREV
jgi:hypothetical protein